MKQLLMEAVLASDDDDDDARLVYADWCEDEGDIDRATFIRTQIERARLSKWDVKQIEMQVREEKLIADHGAEWLAEAPQLEGIRWTGFVRGFPAIAEAESFGGLCDARDAIVQTMPLERITVPWPTSETQAKDAMPIPTLHSLRFCDTDDDGPLWLAGSPLLAGITDLELLDGWAEGSGTRALLGSSRLHGLQRLWMVRNIIGSEAVRALLERDFCALSQLILVESDEAQGWSDWEAGGVEALEALASWPGLARLKHLDLSYNPIVLAGFEHLFRSRHLSNLETLVLNHTTPIAGALPWRDATRLQLQDLALGHHVLEDRSGSVTMHQAPCLRRLRRLSLADASFQSTSNFEDFVGAMAPTLESLDCCDTQVDAPSPSRLVRTPVATASRRMAMRSLTCVSLPRWHTLRVGSAHGPASPGAQTVNWADTVQMHSLQLVGRDLDNASKAIASGTFPNLQRLELEGASDASKALVLESPIGRRLTETGGLRFLPGPQR